MATSSIKQGCGAMIHCTRTNRYLFLLRDNGKYSNTWGLVGGKIELGETVTQGLTREIREEMGGEIRDAKIVPIEQFTSDNGRFSYHTFLINVEEEFVPELNDEHKGYCWVKLEDHPKPLHPGVWRTVNGKTTLDKLKTLERLF